MRSWLQDLVSGARAMRRSPAFLVIAVGTLAIGLGVNAAIFSFINAAFFKTQPWIEPGQLHDVRFEVRGDGRFSPPTLGDAGQALAGIAETAGYEERSFVVSIDNMAAALVPGLVTDSRLFDVLGVPPARGRAFTADDLSAGPAAIVGERFARDRWPGDAIGRIVRIDGIDHTVIGVMPAGFSFRDFAEIWVPLGDPDARRIEGNLTLLARFPDDAARERGMAALRSLAANAYSVTATGTPVGAGDETVRVRMAAVQPNGGVLVLVILAAVGFVLLIACTNVANLMLARGTARRHELAVRASLGASRARIVRCLTAEGIVAAALATGLGLLVGAWGTDVLVAWIPMDQLPLWFDPSMDARVFAYIAVLAAAAALVSSTLPAQSVTRGPLASTLNEAGVRSAGDAGGRLRNALVTAQIALATILLSGATLLVAALAGTRLVDPGYAAGESVLAIDATTVLPDEPTPAMAAMGARPVQDQENTSHRFTIELATRIAAVPGVERTAITSTLPALRLRPALANAATAVSTEAVTAGFFTTIDLPILRGRTFSAVEEGRGDVALISEGVARDLFGDAEAAIGATVLTDPGEDRLTIIGVVRDRRTPADGGLDGIRVEAHLYLPIHRADVRSLRLLARAAGEGDASAIAPALSNTLRAGYPDMVLRETRTLLEMERERGVDLRWFAKVFASFGAFALGLASIGIYGVVAYTVGRRTREIGLRIALGASPGSVAGFVFRSILPAALVGLAAGTLGAIGLGYLLHGTFLGVRVADPLALSGTVLVFFTITMLAAGLPARRAARTDPLSALRAD
ncbi:MAG: ABC transporter permease [Gemmatimonadetes bacterium]|nr:ABC transporter permease [Gemmatimonadota bacterium]